MGLFGNDKQVKALESQVATMRQALTFNMNTSLIQNAIAYYPDSSKYENAIRYATEDDVYSIIRLLATTSAMIPFYAYEIINDKVIKKLKKLQPKADVRVRAAYQVKALEDLPEEDALNELLEQFNDYQSKFEFLEAFYTMLYSQGEAFIYYPKYEEGINKGKPMFCHLMFAQFTVLRVTHTYPQEIVGYDYIVNGAAIMQGIPVEDVIHVKYFNPNYSLSGNELRGLSPLAVLRKRLTRMESNLDNSVSQMQNGGVPGIVYEKGEGTAEVSGRRKDNFYRYLNNKNNKGAPYFSTGDLDYIKLGLSLVDLDSVKLEEVDFKKLCNAYGISDVLFNSSDTNSENNVRTQTKRLYTNSCLPNVFRLRDAINMYITPLYPDKKRFVNCDLSEITELQEDYKEMVTWMSQAYWITPNEKRLMQKFEVLDNPLYDDLLLPTGVQLASDLTAIDPLKMTTQNGD